MGGGWFSFVLGDISRKGAAQIVKIAAQLSIELAQFFGTISEEKFKVEGATFQSVLGDISGKGQHKI